MESPGRGDQGRRPREQARGTHVRGHVWTCVRDANCARFPLTSQSHVAPHPSVSWAVLGSTHGSWLSPQGTRGRHAGLSQLSGGYGPTWAEGQAVTLSTSGLRGPNPSLSGLWHLPTQPPSAARQSCMPPGFWVSLGRFPDLPLLFCEHRPFAPPCPCSSESTVAPQQG